MSHVSQSSSNLHAFKNRGLDVQVDVDTELTAADLSAVTFRVGANLLSKTGLTPVDGGSGVTIDVTLTSADLDFAVGQYRWECFATVSSQVRTLAVGWFTLEDEPTTGA